MLPAISVAVATMIKPADGASPSCTSQRRCGGTRRDLRMLSSRRGARAFNPNCTTGYVCADPATGAPTEQACNLTQQRLIRLRRRCTLRDSDLRFHRYVVLSMVTTMERMTRRLLRWLPGDDQVPPCLPDCAALDSGDVTSCVAVDSEGEGTACVNHSKPVGWDYSLT